MNESDLNVTRLLNAHVWILLVQERNKLLWTWGFIRKKGHLDLIDKPLSGHKSRVVYRCKWMKGGPTFCIFPFNMFIDSVSFP